MTESPIAFDLDGTLITCAPRQQAVLRSVLDPSRDKVDLDRVWELKRTGLSTRDSLREAGVADERSDELARRWQSLVEEPVWLQLDVCFAGSRPVLAALVDKGIELIVLTARSRPWWVVPQLRRLRLDSYFREVITVDPAGARASKAEHLRRVGATAFVGDSESDLAAAAAAGVECLALDTGQRDANVLRQHGAKHVHHRLEDLRLATS